MAIDVTRPLTRLKLEVLTAVGPSGVQVVEDAGEEPLETCGEGRDERMRAEVALRSARERGSAR